MNASWKTTLCGLLALIGAVVNHFYPEYSRHGSALTELAAGLGLLFARDNNVTSERAGANQPGRKRGVFLFLCLVPCLFVACSTTNITELTKALANDPATVDVEIRGPYGSMTFHRSNAGAVTNRAAAVP